MGLEGIVSKKADARYVQARSASWVKVKRVEIATFVVIGFLSNMPKRASSLILAEERDGELVYACRVGSGIGDDKARELYAALSKIERATPVGDGPADAGRALGRAERGPPRSATAAARAATRRGRRCFMSFAAAAEGASRRKALKPRLVGDRDLAAIHLTNPEREIFAGSGVTKLDLALYYARVGDWLLPELLRRPVTMIRCPSGDTEGLLLPAPRLRRPAAGRRDRSSSPTRRGAPPSSPSPSRRAILGLTAVRRGRVPPLGLHGSTIRSIPTGW